MSTLLISNGLKPITLTLPDDPALIHVLQRFHTATRTGEGGIWQRADDRVLWLPVAAVLVATFDGELPDDAFLNG